MSDLHKKILSNKPGLPPRGPITATSSFAKREEHKTTLVKKPREYTLIPWSNYFDRVEDVYTNEGKNRFKVYIKGDSGPVFFFLHGGGFSGLTWALLSARLAYLIRCRCYCMDIRGHGDTKTTNDEDLSIETLSLDVKLVVQELWKNDTSPPIVLVGHSMGGAIAVHTGYSNYVENLIGLVVIDVVEGSAMEALSSMQTFLQGRPKTFNSIEQAIEYNVRSGSIRNAESARVSIIGQLEKIEGSECTSPEPQTHAQILENISHSVMQTEIAEEDEDDDKESKFQKEEAQAQSNFEFKTPQGKPQTACKYKWRIDLSKTEKYWKDWFKGLSSKFLHVNVPKFLLLAGVDRLDKELMVGQMQGKFQMQVLPMCGHAVHEDQPDQCAEALSNFMIRYKFTEPLNDINPPKLSC